MTHLEEFTRVLDLMGVKYTSEQILFECEGVHYGTLITCVGEFWFDTDGKFIRAALLE
jgi:hypothetical protein